MQFHATHKEILEGKTTDIYFHRAEEILKKQKRNPEVTAEIWAKDLPDGYKWAIFTGLHEALQLLENKNLDIWALPEGSAFLEREPILTIKGKYLDFSKMETPLLGYLCQASGISTKAARCKIAAKEKSVLSFGARRMHPSIAPVIGRYAYLGGLDGVSAILAAEKLNIEPKGTVPHAVILIMGDSVKAALAYDKAIPKGVPRIMLVDTFGDEKFESIRLAEKLKDKLDAVRVDTPSSRRGNLNLIVRETREELDYREFNDVGIFVSGGLDENNIKELNPWVEGYGVGTSLSNAPTINFSLDIVEIEGKLLTKKGKVSGKKNVWQCNRCGHRKIVYEKESEPRCGCGNKMTVLTKKIMDKGNITEETGNLETIRKRTLSEMRYLNV